ncbi:cytochrome P450 [Seiridium cupressi]
MAPLPSEGSRMANLALVVLLLIDIAFSEGFTYILCMGIYNLVFHPLASFPGPIAHRVSPIPYALSLMSGQQPRHIETLHRKYGAVVRIRPNELAFSDPQAWKDIYGHRSAGQEEFGKDPQFYRMLNDIPTSIINAPSREAHGAIRRQLAHGFSDRSMRAQEPIIGSYVDLLVKKLHENAASGTQALNLREWYNWATFDIIGDLAFGSSFSCLADADYHPWVQMVNSQFKSASLLRSFAIVGVKFVVRWILRSGVFKSRSAHQALTLAKVQQRMELGAERPDLIEGLLQKKDNLDLTVREVASNASVLIMAGSETTATLLSGATFLLTTHPEALKKLELEVRSSFKAESEITLTSVSNLHYMLACLNETLRCYPPVATGMPRCVPKGGAMVAGRFIPEGVTTAVWQWAINHEPRCWTDPYGFHPERFLGDPKFEKDNLDAMQPFSTGPRNCIGKNLAYAEMRLILARIIFSFDLRLADDSRGWLDTQGAYTLWEKPNLNVYLTPVKR